MSRALYVGWIEEALKVAGIERTDVTGFYKPVGKPDMCLAITFDEEGDPNAFLAGLGAVQERTGGFQAVDVARAAQPDRMLGRPMLYFPGWSLSER